MAMPAMKLDKETFMEDRVVTLEANVGHIRSDISELKADFRRLDVKLDGDFRRLDAKVDRLDAKFDGKVDRLDEKINQLDEKFSTKFDSLKEAVTGLRLAMEQSFSRFALWAIMLYIALAGGLLFVMAKGFEWI